MMCAINTGGSIYGATYRRGDNAEVTQTVTSNLHLSTSFARCQVVTNPLNLHKTIRGDFTFISIRKQNCQDMACGEPLAR